MKPNPVTALAVLILCAGLGACSSSSTDSGPEATVREFYRSINEGDYSNAMTLYSAEALDLWEDPEVVANSSFADWAKGETKSGEVDRVEIVQETLTEKTANVKFEVRYSDGSATSRTVDLVQEDGRWKMGLIG